MSVISLMERQYKMISKHQGLSNNNNILVSRVFKGILQFYMYFSISRTKAKPLRGKSEGRF